MNHIKSLFCLLLLSNLVIPVLAQNTISATGGSATGSGGFVSYTIGQIANGTFSSTSGIVAQGVQQPYEISVLTTINAAKDISLIFSIYPNPSSDFLTLKVENFEIVKLSCWLYGVGGNLIESKKVLSSETQIRMTNQVSGSYFLKVTVNNKEVKTFKIIKN